MNTKYIVVGIAVAVMAWSLGMNILQWQMWVFILATNVALTFSSYKSKD